MQRRDDVYSEFLELQNELEKNRDMSQSCITDLMKQLQQLKHQV